MRSGKLLSLEHAAVVPRSHPVVFLELRAEVLRGEKSGQTGDFLSAQFAFHKKAGGMFDPELFEKLKRRLMEFFREPGGQRGLADLEERGQRFVLISCRKFRTRYSRTLSAKSLDSWARFSSARR